MSNLALAIALACVLSGVAHAGEIPSTWAGATPTPSTMTTTGEIHTTGVIGEIPTTGVFGEIHSTGATASSSVLTIILTLISIVP